MNKKSDSIDLTALHIDFASNSNTYRRLHGGGRGQPIARAVGLKTYGLPLTVLDATAGLGQDAFVLASLGCKVTMLERTPLLAEQLRDALLRGSAVESIREIISNMQLVETNSIEYMQQLATRTDVIFPDVVYLDPMFPERTKSALVKKEMRALKELVGEDLDADQLLAAACKIAMRRVVVKRPKNAEYLGGVTPHASQVGSANRFDLYLPQR